MGDSPQGLSPSPPLRCRGFNYKKAPRSGVFRIAPCMRNSLRRYVEPRSLRVIVVDDERDSVDMLTVLLNDAVSCTVDMDAIVTGDASLGHVALAGAQLGYMFGALIGGAVLAVADFGTLGFVLLAGMAASAALVARVSDRTTAGLPRESPAAASSRDQRAAS